MMAEIDTAILIGSISDISELEYLKDIIDARIKYLKECTARAVVSAALEEEQTMDVFGLLISIFFALTTSINIIGILASFSAIKKYQESLDILHECEEIMTILDKYRQG